ncbi:MAG: hypothetical protein FWE03_03105 [Firmicutes bacterium]|nr:hypothetical protein [Bacillota bacterium]
MQKLNEKIDLTVKDDAESLMLKSLDEKVKIIDIAKIIDDAIFKIEISYEAIKGDKVIGNYFDLSIARDKYDDIEEAFDIKNGMYDEFKAVLERLVRLQGFDRLGKWNVWF